MLSGGAPFDPAVEAKLDRWVAAKREKDFGTADAIRAELRAQGIEPDTIRPSDREAPLVGGGSPVALGPYRGGSRYELTVEAKLDRWVLAKREKDFGTADAIRAELRALGIEPDSVRPPDREALLPIQLPKGAIVGGPAFGALAAFPRYDAATEAKLDRWVLAKREKDFGSADAIRAELRAAGIEPDQARPADRDAMLGLPMAPVMELPRSPLLSPTMAGARFDPMTEAKLDRWVVAKREKDFGTADALRAELRASGIEPDAVRPPDREMLPSVPIDTWTEAKLDRWVAAKREKDFDTADALRAELRALGIEPDAMRPPDRDMTPVPPSAMLPGNQFDASTEAKLDRWVLAKRDKDWATADALRGELRGLGIEPDVVRPPDREVQPSAGLDPDAEAMLDRWVLAKREKDFGTADAIREELRALGLEPDALRPPDRDLGAPVKGPCPSATRFDAFTEAQLDRWVQAKRDKDFGTADSIRASLRARGIEPDVVRPSDRDASPPPSDRMPSPLARHMVGAQPGWSDASFRQGASYPLSSHPGASAGPQFAQNWGYLGGPGMYRPGQAVPVVGRSASIYSQFQGQPMALHAGRAAAHFSLAPAGSTGARGASAMGASAYDPETQVQLDRWVQAKRDRDFAAADAIRAELRAQGIEPDSVRPSDRDLKEKAPRQVELPAAGRVQWGQLAALNLSPGLQREVERQLERWAEAKRARDWATVDVIGAQLRAKGIEPDGARPIGLGTAGGPAKRARGSDW